MPRSSHRHHHHKQHVPTHLPHKKKKAGTGLALLIFFALLGTGIGFFAGNGSIGGLIAGAIVGALIGFLFGRVSTDDSK